MKKCRFVLQLVLALVAVFAAVSFGSIRSEAANSAAAYALVFDAEYYYNKYPDLQKALGNNETALLNHFLNYGMKEGRVACDGFNVKAYRARYEDLQAAFGDDLRLYYQHYINFGETEKRDATGDGTGWTASTATTATTTTTNTTDQTVASTYPKATAVLDKIGYDMKTAFNWSAGMTYYGHGKADMPEVPDPGIHWFATYGFDNYKGNCFVMAATFYEMAKVMGYSPRQMCGYVPSRAGGMTIHSWVEIDVDGKTYVCDPDFTYGTGKNGFMIQYGQSGTWRYTSYSAMSE